MLPKFNPNLPAKYKWDEMMICPLNQWWTEYWHHRATAIDVAIFTVCVRDNNILCHHLSVLLVQVKEVASNDGFVLIPFDKFRGEKLLVG